VKSGDDSPSAIDHDWMLDVSDDDNGGPNLENEFVGWETPHFECIKELGRIVSLLIIRYCMVDGSAVIN
jgi:hypothetical protein